MKLLLRRYRLPAIIGILLAAGFLVTSIAGYMVSLRVIDRNIVEQSLPRAAESIKSTIATDVQRPILISSLMANDSFVRQWITGGEQDHAKITEYLAEIKRTHGMTGSFLVSQRTRQYYSSDGSVRTIGTAGVPDRWFNRLEASHAAYMVELDINPDLTSVPVLFVNYKVLDRNRNFLGVIGIALKLEDFLEVLKTVQKQFNRQVLFVDSQGKVIMGKPATIANYPSLSTRPGLATLAPRLLQKNAKVQVYRYVENGQNIYVTSQYLPDLDWYLIVEQSSEEEVKPVQRVLIANIIISAAVTLSVMLIAMYLIDRYRQRLEHIAGTDSLTGLLNRQAFDAIFSQALLEVQRSHQPLSCILFDIDFFKQVNDTFGHLAGDGVLKEVACVARSAVRRSDVVARWGGEEFIVLLKSCPLQDAAQIAEKLRAAVEIHDFSKYTPGRQITVSLGVASHTANVPASDILARADGALYQAKETGRNRVALAAGHRSME